jgi:ketosteroid isomerase-like protein
MPKRLALLLALPLTLALATTAAAAPPPAADTAAIRKTLDDSAVAWSRGDLDGFMAAYEDSPETAFVTPQGVLRGWAPVRERYRKTYGQGNALGALSFSDFEVTALGSDYAIAYGRFHLKQPGAKAEQTGVFDLIMHRTEKGWRILSDHTS